MTEDDGAKYIDLSCEIAKVGGKYPIFCKQNNNFFIRHVFGHCWSFKLSEEL